MSNRLAIDGSLVGYWGFDEALETDVAVDATANGYDLSVTSSDGTAPGRIGNSRHFNGSASFASITNAGLRLTGDLTLMAWVKLNSYNGTGTQLRAFASCGGPATSDNSYYCLSVTLLGALRYSHTSTSGEVVVQTANSTIRTGQFYCVQARRVTSGGNQTIELYVDNVQKTPTTITVNGVSQAQPVPPAALNAPDNTVFSIGRSQREANSAFWDGYIDEVSVHSVARPYHAYLIDAYFRGALRSSTTKLSATNTVVAVSSYEMGAGVRWWCLERDKDLYVVKESPFGNFGPETRLTTVGGGNSSLTGKPELVYDAASDTLYVFFVSGNRIYKLTANATDDPATVNMPYTADTGSIIKAVDLVDGGRLGDSGAAQRSVREEDFTYVNRGVLKMNVVDSGSSLGDSGAAQQFSYTAQPPHAPQIAFVTVPPLGFGVVIGPIDSEVGGYALYEVTGGVAVEMATPVKLSDLTNRYFGAVSPRRYGRAFVAEALNPNGKKTGVFSAVITDRFNEVRTDAYGRLQSGVEDSDNNDSGSLGDSGAAQRSVREEDFTYVNRTPVKLSLQDPATNNLGDSGAGQQASVTQNSKTVVL